MTGTGQSESKSGAEAGATDDEPFVVPVGVDGKMLRGARRLGFSGIGRRPRRFATERTGRPGVFDATIDARESGVREHVGLEDSGGQAKPTENRRAESIDSL